MVSVSITVGQWSSDPSINTVVTNEWGLQVDPLTISDNNGGAIIIWWDWQADFNIYAQRVNKFGFRLWPTEGLPVCTMPGSQSQPVAISDGAGGAVIVWQDTRSDIGDIYAQRIDSTGSLLWNGDQGITIYEGPGVQRYPNVVSDQSSFYITWADNRYGLNQPFCQKVSFYGELIWPDEGVQVVNYDNQLEYFFREMTPNGLGGLYFIWKDTRYSGEEYHHELWGNRIGSDGTRLWGNGGIPIAQEGRSNGGQASMVRISDNSIICVYLKQIEEDSIQNLYAQRISPEGNLIWGNEVPICTTPGDKWIYYFFSDDFDNLYMEWHDHRNDNWDIYAQKLNSEGIVQWAGNGVSVCSHESGQMMFEYILDQNNHLITVWRDGRNIATSYYDIYAQVINSDGSYYWEEDGLPISIADGAQEYPTLTKSQNSIIISWVDKRYSPERDIFAQQISIFGELGDIPVPLGDLNMDTITDILDIIMVVDIVLGNSGGTEYQLWAGDINEDEIIDVLDIVIMVNIILEG